MRYDAGVVVQRNVHQLAGAISDLLSNREGAACLGDKTDDGWWKERYSLEAVGKALHQLYQKIIS